MQFSLLLNLTVLILSILARTNNYEYASSSVNACSNLTQLDLFIWIHSAVQNFHKRSVIRMTWAHPSLYPSSVSIKFIFFLGLPNRASLSNTDDVVDDTKQEIKKLQMRVLYEQEHHGDIVQGQFYDSYRNMTKKALYSMNWINKYCPLANLVLKIDDDVLLNYPRLIAFLRVKSHKKFRPESIIFCDLWNNAQPIRVPNNKWYISEEDYPSDKYPPFCRGMAFMMSMDLFPRILKESEEVEEIFMDDVYITGLVASRLSQPTVTYRKLSGEMVTSDDRKYDGYISLKLKWKMKTTTFALMENMDSYLELWDFLF